MGHLKASLDDLDGETPPKKRDDLADESEKYVWTYTSPEFPMAQVSNFVYLSFCTCFSLNNFCYIDFLMLDTKN